MTINGFFHVACMGHWKDIFVDMMVQINESGLLSKTKKLTIGFIGNDSDSEFIRKYVRSNANISIVDCGNDLKKYEFPTLVLLNKAAVKEDGAVYYLHTKGSSKPNDEYYKQWRQYMMDCCVRDHEEIIRVFPKYDIAGGARRHGSHFTGNFWWATCKHIRKLVPIAYLWKHPNKLLYPNTDEENMRLQAEFWLGSKNGMKVYNMGVLDPCPFFNKKIYIKA